MIGTLGALWGLVGVYMLLGSAVYRLWVLAFIGLSYELLWYHWIVLILIVFFMAYAEGYRGFQKGFSPRVAARAKYLREQPSLLRSLLAPFFCMGYFHASRKRKIVSISLTIGIIGLIIMVSRVPQPWRGIIDVGVVIGLIWGIISLIIFTIQAFTSTAFNHSPEVPVEQDIEGV